MVVLSNREGRRACGVPAKRNFIQDGVKGLWTEAEVGGGSEASENQAGHMIQLSIAIFDLVDGEIRTVG
jgi:hypothetical protein